MSYKNIRRSLRKAFKEVSSCSIMSELTKIEGKTVLITGAASGLGAGYTESFLKHGAEKVAVLDIAEEVGKAFVEKLNKVYPGTVIFIKCDCSNEESLTEAFNEVVKAFKTVDVVVNNAGLMNDSPNIWRKASDINYQGMVSLTLKSLKHMSKDEGGQGGTVINVSSCLGFLKHPYLPIYAGSKAGILHFSHCIAMDPFHERTGIRIMTMCYGPTDTPLLQNLEIRSYNEKCGNEMAAAPTFMQKPESAITGFEQAFKKGGNGTIWLVTDDKEAEDITPVIDDAFDRVQKKLYPAISS